MIPMCSEAAKERLLPVLKRIGLPTRIPFASESLLEAMVHDKKMSGDSITLIRVDRVGSYRMEKIPFSRFAEEVKGRKE